MSPFKRSGFALLPFLLILTPNLWAQLVPTAGLDQVLSSFASVVKDRANQVALDVVREQLVSTLNKKQITLNADNGQKDQLYLGGLPSPTPNPSPDPSSIYFEKSFGMLSSDDQNLALTDPVLLKTVSQDFVDFSFRIIFLRINDADYKSLNMRGLSKFVYQSIDAMTRTGADVHDLGSPLIELSNSISVDFEQKLIAEIKQNASLAKPINLTSDQIHSVLDLQVRKMQESRAVADSDSIINSYNKQIESTISGYTGISLSVSNERKLNTIGGENYISVFLPKDYAVASSNGNRELAALFRLSGSILYADQIDHDSTNKWLTDYSNNVTDKLSDLSGKDVRKILKLLTDCLPQSPASGSGKLTGDTLTGAFQNLLDTLSFGYYVRPGATDLPVGTFIVDIKNIVSSIKGLLTVSSTPEQVGAKMAALLKSFSTFIKDSNQTTTPEGKSLVDILDKTTLVLTDVSSRDWMGLIQLAYDNISAIDGNKTDIKNILSFARVLMQVYQAESVDDAKQVLTASLEDLSSRRNRFNSPITLDVTALVGVRGGYQHENKNFFDLDNRTSLFGLYAPLGLQMGMQGFGLMVYPVDLGTYLTDNGQTNADVRVGDAVRLGGAVYGRIKEIPIDIGLGSDYRVPSGAVGPEFRSFVFASLELPLFMIH